jgi:DNA-binding response OmpR family regulator
MTLKVEKGDIVKFIKSLVYSFEEYAIQKKISLIFECPFPELQMWFDPDKTDKIFFNLLSNAFKFTGERGQITVKMSRIKVNENENPVGYIQIEINDTGKGIAKEHLDKIFDRFYQVDENTTYNQGSGLGLALTKSFVDIHHGKIFVDSIPCAGTSFKVLLPESDSVFSDEEKITNAQPMFNQYIHPIPLIDTDSQSEANKTGKIFPDTILVVEDNYDLRNYLYEELKDDYNIRVASNGSEGLKIAVDELPDLIISDIMMPELNGFELCKAIKSNIITSHIPVLLLTAKTENEQKIEGYSYGADAYITKPFDIDSIKAQVKQIIQNRKRLKEKFSSYVFSHDENENQHSYNDKFVDKVTNHIMKNLAEQSLNVEHLSQDLGMSRGHLHRKIKSAVGLGPNEYIRMIRLKEAAKLMIKNNLNISEISLMVGFNNPAYFTKCFKDYYHLSPTEFISKNKRSG